MMDPGNEDEDSEVVLGKFPSSYMAKFPSNNFLLLVLVEWYLNLVFEVTQLSPYPIGCALPCLSSIGRAAEAASSSGFIANQ